MSSLKKQIIFTEHFIPLLDGAGCWLLGFLFFVRLTLLTSLQLPFHYSLQSVLCVFISSIFRDIFIWKNNIFICMCIILYLSVTSHRLYNLQGAISYFRIIVIMRLQLQVSGNQRGNKIRTILNIIIQSETIYVACLNTMIQVRKLMFYAPVDCPKRVCFIVIPFLFSTKRLYTQHWVRHNR